MCGIAGLFSLAGNLESCIEGPIDQNIYKMTKELSQRGPDAQGIRVTPRAAFGHRRLSVLDLTSAGNQPMVSGESGVMITYNGEIYNFQSLRHILVKDGFSFKSDSDTEVLLRCYEKWGLDAFDKLEGIFALGLWDPERKRLVLVRDRLGVKPLYFSVSDSLIVFASEMRSILSFGGIEKKLNDQSFSEFLWFGNCFDERTFLDAVKVLKPGEMLVCEKGVIETKHWWKIEEYFSQEYASLSFSEMTDLLLERIDSAVKRQQVADVPIALFLSGGLDSSTVAAALSTSQQEEVKAFVCSFDFYGGVNEVDKATAIANYCGIPIQEIQVSSDTLIDALFDLGRSHGDPFSDAANIPLYLACREISSNYKVVLQGDGGDELFGGYPRYLGLANLGTSKVFAKLLSASPLLLQNIGPRLRRLVSAFSQDDYSKLTSLLMTVETLEDSPVRYLNNQKARNILDFTDPFDVYKAAEKRFKEFKPADAMMLTDLTTELPNTFLTKVDRASMCSGVEARVPLLDESVLELAVNIPSKWKVNLLGKKYILKKSQQGRLPKKIMNIKKTGFGVPYQHWLRTTLKAVAKSRILDRSFIDKYDLDMKNLERAFEEHSNYEADRGFALWKFLQLSIHDEFLNSFD